jgi:uncharacterized coiled-coil DUF342 family protein
MVTPHAIARQTDKLKAKSEQASAEARAKFDEQLKAMRGSRDAASKKLQEMRAASESAWQHIESQDGRRVGVDEERLG